MSNNNKFSYTYSAPTEAERREIDSIRRQYGEEKREVSDMDRLRALHAKVKNGATCVSLVLGIVGTLIFGLGLTMILEWGMIIFGIILMALGTIPIALALPIYRAVLKRNKEKYGAEILRLSDEILNKEKE